MRLRFVLLALVAVVSCSRKPAAGAKSAAAETSSGASAPGAPLTPPVPTALPTATLTPGPGVVWEKDVGNALIGAAASFKPCVVLLGKPPSNDYQRLVKQFEDSRFEPLRRFSVWAKGNPETDSYARTIVDTLHLTSLPAVVILEPTGAELKEAARVTGYAEAPALEERLGPAIHKVFDSWQAKRERAPTPTP